MMKNDSERFCWSISKDILLYIIYILHTYYIIFLYLQHMIYLHKIGIISININSKINIIQD